MAGDGLRTHVETDPLFMENGYVLYVRDGGDCWMIDPGLPPHGERMSAFANDHRLTLAAILLTHAHGDHIAGVDEVRSTLGPAPLYLARPEWPFLSDPARNLSAQFDLSLTVSTDNLHDLSPGSELSLEGTAWAVLDTSGHSPGGRSLYCASAGLVIVGDALFAGSIGRTDLPHSDGRRLLANIRDHLLTLPGPTRVLSGHGPDTTIARERRTNPFLEF